MLLISTKRAVFEKILYILALYMTFLLQFQPIISFTKFVQKIRLESHRLKNKQKNYLNINSFWIKLKKEA